MMNRLVSLIQRPKSKRNLLRRILIEQLEERALLAIDIEAVSILANNSGDGRLHASYGLSEAVSEPFEIGLIAVDNSGTGIPDALLATMRVESPAGLAEGVHVISWRPDFVDLEYDYLLFLEVDTDNSVFESNESNNRSLFSEGAFQLANGVVQVHGSSLADVIELSAGATLGRPIIAFNNIALTVGNSLPFSGLSIRTHGGADIITDNIDYGNWQLPVAIYAGSANDTISVNIQSASIDSGVGVDTVTINGSSGPDYLLVDGYGIQRGGAGRTDLVGTENLIVLGLAGEDNFRFEGSPAGVVNVTLIGGSENDVLDLSRPLGAILSPDSVAEFESIDLQSAGLDLLDSSFLEFVSDLQSITHLDLRYNNLDLSNVSTLNELASGFGGLAELQLYGNPSFDTVPNLSALAGAWLRVDIAPVNLQSAEQGADEATVLASIANSLHNLPLHVIEYVVNNFEYEVYSGQKKSPLSVIHTGKGNDWDLSNLTRSLLSYAGLSTQDMRYAGNRTNGNDFVYLTAENSREWLGTTEASDWRRESVLDLLQSGGSAYGLAHPLDNKLDAVIFDQIWLEVSGGKCR